MYLNNIFVENLIDLISERDNEECNDSPVDHDIGHNYESLSINSTTHSMLFEHQLNHSQEEPVILLDENTTGPFQEKPISTYHENTTRQLQDSSTGYLNASSTLPLGQQMVTLL